MKNKTSNRRLIFQLTAVVVLIAIAYAMTIIGRGTPCISTTRS